MVIVMVVVAAVKYIIQTTYGKKRRGVTKVEDGLRSNREEKMSVVVGCSFMSST